MSFFIATFLLFSGAPAYAQTKHKKLTKENVTAFIHRTTDIMNHNNNELSIGNIKSYLDTHLYKKSRFKSTMKYNIPGQPAQIISMSLDKKEFIKSIEDSQQSLDSYENEIEVLEVNISKNGKKAVVQTSGREVGVIPVSADGVSTENVPIEGTSSCNQVISLNKKGIIQMYSAQCSTEINFQPGY